MEDVNNQRRNFASLSELGYGSFKLSFRRARLHLTKWVELIAINTERTQIHFLSDVLVAVASWDLKVLNYCLLNPASGNILLEESGILGFGIRNTYNVQ